MGVDWAWGVSIDFTVHGQVAVSGDGDPLGSCDGVVVDRLGVGVRACEFREHTAACRPVPLLSPDVFRS